MRLSVKNRSLIAAIMVLTAAVAVLGVVCITDIHVPLAGIIGDACLAMVHTTGLGAASSTGVMSVVLMFVATGAGVALMFMASFSKPSSRRFAFALAQQANPLNGRLRV